MLVHDVDKVFWDHVHKYDAHDPNILKKIVHSFAVANNAFNIACSLGFNQEDRMFCYIMGLFHDIGRFEQWKLFKAFNDKTTMSHGVLGVKAFKEYIDPQSLQLSTERAQLLLDTILYHIDIYQGDDQNLWKYLDIIHTADAYSNLLFVALGNQDYRQGKDGYTPLMLEKFYENDKLFKYPIYTKVDRILVSLSNANAIKYPHLRQNIIERHYFDAIFETYKDHFSTEDQKVIRDAIDYLNKTYK